MEVQKLNSITFALLFFPASLLYTEGAEQKTF